MSKNGLSKVQDESLAPAAAAVANRQKLLAAMTDATKKVAEECARKIGQGNRGNTMTYYYIGSRMIDALDEAKQGEYGSKAADQLAAFFLKGDTNLLYGLRQFAQTYDEAFVKEWAEKEIPGGEYISTQHWIKLSAMADAVERQKMFDAVVVHGLSAGEIARRLRSGEVQAKNVRTSGGRKVTPPSSLLSGLEKLRTDMLKVDNYAKMCEKHVFGRLASMPVADFTDTHVAKLKADKEVLSALKDRLASADKYIDACLARGEQALAEKAEKAGKAEKVEKGENKKPAAKAKAEPPKAKAKPAAKPAAKGGTAKPKVKAGRPTPATAGA